ncbi:MAG: TIGR03619 family F420-dependent LLM class oxidoreductase [Candidatus Rokubacteria bacterium]|nr:TIGR03619 family F420-dependent LLM class oxidoreductase [Candidatus Rokubacteria bacterium]
MKFGVFLPISGRAASGVLLDAARRAEALGYDSVWAADRIVTPWEIRTPYPYSADRRFIVPPEAPFLEPLTCLAFLAGGTARVVLGMSVLVMPYRHPLYWAKIATTIDHLSKGRLILGVGVGWMAEEFDALDVPFKERGAMADEQLRVVHRLWTEEKPRFEGHYYRFDEVGFAPKPLQKPRIPIWIGGEGTRAQRRAGVYGDAWFPYFVRITPRELAARFEHVRRAAAEAGRDPAGIRLACCLPIELTQEPVPQEPDRLMGTPEQVTQALQGFGRVGVEHVALQFMVPRWPERLAEIERFAREAMPALR